MLSDKTHIILNTKIALIVGFIAGLAVMHLMHSEKLLGMY